MHGHQCLSMSKSMESLITAYVHTRWKIYVVPSLWLRVSLKLPKRAIWQSLPNTTSSVGLKDRIVDTSTTVGYSIYATMPAL